MTREEMLDGLYEIKNWKCDGDAKMYEVVTEAIKALEQEPILDKIRFEIMEVANQEKFHDGKWVLGLRYAVNIIDKYKADMRYSDFKAERGERNMIKTIWENKKEKILKSVILLDLFTKNFCRYRDDYYRYEGLKYRCEECPFLKDDGTCLVKMFKEKYAPDYRDFRSMGDH